MEACRRDRKSRLQKSHKVKAAVSSTCVRLLVASLATLALECHSLSLSEQFNRLLDSKSVDAMAAADGTSEIDDTFLTVN